MPVNPMSTHQVTSDTPFLEPNLARPTGLVWLPAGSEDDKGSDSKHEKKKSHKSKHRSDKKSDKKSRGHSDKPSDKSTDRNVDKINGLSCSGWCSDIFHLKKNVYTCHMKTANHPPACPAFKRPFSSIYVYSQKE